MDPILHVLRLECLHEKATVLRAHCKQILDPHHRPLVFIELDSDVRKANSNPNHRIFLVIGDVQEISRHKSPTFYPSGIPSFKE